MLEQWALQRSLIGPVTHAEAIAQATALSAEEMVRNTFIPAQTAVQGGSKHDEHSDVLDPSTSTADSVQEAGLATDAALEEMPTSIQLAQAIHNRQDPAIEAQLSADQPASANATLNKLREWYRAARDLNMAAEHLDAIKMLGLAAKQRVEQGHAPELSAEVQQKMHETLGQYETRQGWGLQIAAQAKRILEQIGQPTDNGQRRFAGKLYQLSDSAEGLTVHRIDKGTPQEILNVRPDGIRCAAVTEEDVERFDHFLAMLSGRAKQAVRG